MFTRKPFTFFSLFLIFVVCLSLLKVDIAFADDGAPTETPPITEPTTEPPVVTDVPTEPPTATEVPTEPTVEATPLPIETTPTPEGEIQPADSTELAASEEPAAAENTPAAPILSLVPEDTSVVVLDEQGKPVSLATQDAAEALIASDPVWCPASVSAPTPGANNCSVSYASITALIDAMRTNPTAFDENGTIFLERPAGQGFTTPLILDNSATSLGASFATLSAFNITVQGAWNGNSPGTFGANTNFGVAGGNQGYILIGSAVNPWVGNVTLADITLSGISAANSVTVYTSSGNIVLDDIEVQQQTGTQYTAYLSSTSGNITVGNTSFFDGDNTGGDRSKGFYAQTNTGSISITGTGNINSPTFQDARGTDPANYNGATLSAPVVTLTNVISVDNDGNGIEILNANVVTLNNVVSGLVPNGGGQPYSEGNGLSGVLINGTGSTVVTINGGSFNRNKRYGIEILDSASISMPTSPTYDGNVLGNFYENGLPNTSITSHPPSPTNSTSATFSFTGSDNFTSAGNLIFQCSLDGAAFAVCTSPTSYAGLAEGSHSFQVRSQDQSNNVDSTPASFSWIIDLTPPVIAAHADVTVEATSAAGAIANYTSPATSDTIDGPGVASCTPASGTFFAFGDTLVNCTATDTAGNAAIPTFFTVHVVDTTGPVIAAHADETAEATSAAGSLVSYSDPTAVDAVDGPRPVSCSPASGSQFPPGNTTVNCSATDLHNNTATSSFVVHVVDTTAPVITSHPDETAEATSAGGAVVNYTSPTTSDIVDGAGVATCAPASGFTFPLGNTIVNCTATDSHSNAAVPTFFTVHVVDTTAPIIAAHADETAEATGASGAVVTYTAPTTFDLVDGAGTATCSPASGSPFPLGNTSVNCTATDSHSNTAASSFVVHVVDTTAPTLNLPGTITAIATGPSGAIVFYSVSATDIVDGSVATNCSPASGSIFPLGSTTVNCSATDLHSNTASGSFIINVYDPAAPILSLPSDMTVEATSSTGAVVTFSASATDVVDGSVPVTCVPPSGSIFPLGTTIVGCSASDSSGNMSNGGFKVTVVDTTAPTIASHLDITVGTSDPAGIIVNYSSPSTSDLVDGAGTASCSAASGSLFPLGNTTVTCTASDSRGNTSTSTFVVHVVKPIIHSTPGSKHTTSEFVIPLTGGGLVDLNCNSIFWIHGIRVGFLNLCDFQATMNGVTVTDLPDNLPTGYSFVSGLDVNVLQNGQMIKDLPDGSGVRMDFPISNASKSQFAVLYWSDDDNDGKGEWIEISQQITEDKLSETLHTHAEDELYRLLQNSKQAASVFHSILTTDKTGIFVLVTK